MDGHAFLQGIFLNQGSNPGVLHCRWILYHLSHQGSRLWHLLLLSSFLCSSEQNGSQVRFSPDSPAVLFNFCKKSLFSDPLVYYLCTVLKNEKFPIFLFASLRSVVPNLFGTWGLFHASKFFCRPGRRWFWDDSSMLHLLCTSFLLLLHQLHLRSSGIRSQRLRTPDLDHPLHSVLV